MNTMEEVTQSSERLEVSQNRRHEHADKIQDFLPKGGGPIAAGPLPSRRIWRVPVFLSGMAVIVYCLYLERVVLQNASPYVPVAIPSLIALR